jgi:hypothetical protein
MRVAYFVFFAKQSEFSNKNGSDNPGRYMQNAGGR